MNKYLVKKTYHKIKEHEYTGSILSLCHIFKGLFLELFQALINQGPEVTNSQNRETWKNDVGN